MAHEYENMDEYRKESYMERNGYVYCEMCDAIGDWGKYDCWHGDDSLYWCGCNPNEVVYTARIRDEHFETLGHELLPIEAAEGKPCRVWFDRYLA